MISFYSDCPCYSTERLALFDHVATTDRLSDSMIFLSKKYGLQLEDMKLENTGNHGVVRDDLSETTLDAIYTKSWADIELYELAVQRAGVDLGSPDSLSTNTSSFS